MKKSTYLLITISFISYFISLLIFKFDTNFTYRWPALYLSILPLLLIVLLWIFSLVPYKNVLVSINLYGFLAIFALAITSRFIFLTSYPYVSVGDEVRDGGLYALEIATGQIKNIFDYLQYYGAGLIIPTITSVFYKIFGNSVLTYRIPAALVSVLDVVLFYLLLSLLTKNKLACFLGAIVLVSLPLHLFYSRTEIAVILSSLFSTLILLGLFIFLRRRTTNVIDYIFLGALLGFTFNLHGDIIVFALMALTNILLITFWQWFSGRLELSQFGIKLLLLTFFLLVGFGPRLLNTTPEIFFRAHRVPFFSTEKQSDLNSYDIKSIAEKYKRSLLVWITEPTNAWYPDHKPIFPPLLFSFMILGVFVGITRKNLYLIFVFFVTLVLHATNSALTDILNGDHRLVPLYPIGTLFVGVGMAFLIDKIKLRLFQYILAFALFIFLFYQTTLFFINQPANKNKDIGDYLSMHTIYFIKENDDLIKSNNLILFVSMFNYQKLNLLHYKQQYAFFFPAANFTIEKDETIKDNEIYIKNSKYDFWGKDYIIECGGKSYYCPIGYRTNIVIHY